MARSAPLFLPREAGEGDRAELGGGGGRGATSLIHSVPVRRTSHEPALGAVPARPASRPPRRRGRHDGRGVFSLPRHSGAFRHRAGSQPPLPDRTRHPVDRGAPVDAAGARPALRRRSRGRVARPPAHGRHAAGTRRGGEMPGALVHHGPAAGDRVAALRADAGARRPGARRASRRRCWSARRR